MAECQCAAGWICEEHPSLPWPHDDCLGPGMKCDNPECRSWQGETPAALNPQGWISLASSKEKL